MTDDNQGPVGFATGGPRPESTVNDSRKQHLKQLRAEVRAQLTQSRRQRQDFSRTRFHGNEGWPAVKAQVRAKLREISVAAAKEREESRRSRAAAAGNGSGSGPDEAA